MIALAMTFYRKSFESNFSGPPSCDPSSVSHFFFQIIRKVAFKIVKKEADRIDVAESSVEQFVGKPIFTHDRIYEATPPGVVMGLAWTAMGT